MVISGKGMRLINLLLMAVLLVPPLAHAELVELVTIYGPSGGAEFCHVCGPGDVNGDGYDDFIISSPTRDRRIHECENGYARLYFGGDPIDTSNYITIPAVCDQPQYNYNGFGSYCTGAGYINGDSYPDFLIGDPWYDFNWQGPWFSGGGFVYWGGPVIDTLPGLRLVTETFNSWSKFYGLGDVNGDSFDDIVSSTQWTDDAGPVNIYLGGDPPDSIPDFQIWPFFGYYPVIAEPAKIVGDYNGDGKDDIVLCNPAAMADSGLAFMFFGSDTGFSQPDLVFQGQGGWSFGRVLSGCGDLNSDGFDDFMIGSLGTLSIYYGAQNPDSLPDLIIHGDRSMFPNYLSGREDLNGDDYIDIAVSNSWWSQPAIAAGQVLIYYGGEQMDTIADIVICGEDRYQRFGIETAFPGDINGDGYPEFIASSEYYEDPGRSCVTIYTTNMSSVGDSHPLPLVTEIELTCYPNPFNASTTITLKAGAKEATLEIFDLAGRKVRSFNLPNHSGQAQVVWDGTNEAGQGVSSGIYFCRLTAGSLSATKKLVLIR
jgi:hypothetical protein